MHRYAALKDKSFVDIAKKKLRKLLNEVNLDDRRRNCSFGWKAQDSVSKEVLKSLWLQYLSQHVQAILTVIKHKLEELLQLADRITDM